MAQGSASANVDVMARLLAISGFLVNLVALIITYRRGRRTRANLTFGSCGGDPVVELTLTATGSLPVSVVSRGFSFSRTWLSLPHRVQVKNSYTGFVAPDTGPGGPPLPWTLTDGAGVPFTFPFHELRFLHGDADGDWVRGWAVLATKKRALRTRPMRLQEMVALTFTGSSSTARPAP